MNSNETIFDVHAEHNATRLCWFVAFATVKVIRASEATFGPSAAAELRGCVKAIRDAAEYAFMHEMRDAAANWRVDMAILGTEKTLRLMGLRDPANALAEAHWAGAMCHALASPERRERAADALLRAAPRASRAVVREAFGLI